MQIEEGDKAGYRVLIPFAREIVTSVNVHEGFLTVNPPTGLLDLVRSPKQENKKKQGKRNKKRDDVRRLKELRAAEKLTTKLNVGGTSA